MQSVCHAEPANEFIIVNPKHVLTCTSHLHCTMEQKQLLDCIDVRLVKEQLRLLGHDVTDDVIMSFVKGLAGGAEQQCADGSAARAEAGQDVHNTPAGGLQAWGDHPELLAR